MQVPDLISMPAASRLNSWHKWGRRTLHRLGYSSARSSLLEADLESSLCEKRILQASLAVL